MAESTLNLTYTNLETESAFLAGLNTTVASIAAGTRARLDECIQAGYRKFLFPPPFDGTVHKWSFMHPRYTLTLSAPYSTGTITVVDGVVTGSGTTFTSAMAAYELINGSDHYTVASYSSATSITLDDLTLDVAAGSTYSLVQSEYDLPDDFGWMEGQTITFEPSSNSQYVYGANRVSEQKIRELRAAYPERTGTPQYFSIFVDTHVVDGTESVRWKVGFWPAPDSAYRADFCYTRAAPKISESNDYFLGGMLHAETIREAVLSEVERVFHDQEGVHTRLFQERLATSISLDRQASSPATGGYNGDRSDEWEYGNDDLWPYFAQRPYSSRIYTAP